MVVVRVYVCVCGEQTKTSFNLQMNERLMPSTTHEQQHDMPQQTTKETKQSINDENGTHKRQMNTRTTKMK
jgi:hypothetical protein